MKRRGWWNNEKALSLNLNIRESSIPPRVPPPASVPPINFLHAPPQAPLHIPIPRLLERSQIREKKKGWDERMRITAVAYLEEARASRAKVRGRAVFVGYRFVSVSLPSLLVQSHLKHVHNNTPNSARYKWVVPLVRTQHAEGTYARLG